MSRLEDLIRETLATHEKDAPDSGKLLSSPQGLSDRRMGRRWVTVVITATTLVLMVGVTLFAVNGHHPPDYPSVRPAEPGPAIPKGMQPVSFHGVQVFVPAAWALNNTRCGIPIADTAIIEIGAAESCFVPQPPGLTVVRLTTSDTVEGRRRSQVATQPTTVNGHQARRGVGVPQGEDTTLAVLVLTDPGLVLSAESPNLKDANAILDTAQIVSIDSFGCVAHVSALIPSRVEGRAGAVKELVPGAPVTAAICFYTDDWLGRSVLLTQAQKVKLQGVFNDLPEGVSYPVGFSESPEACRADAKRGYLVLFVYDFGSPVNVYVHIGGCNGLSATNGSRTTKINASLVSSLSIAGYDAGIPDPTNLR